MTSGSKKRSGLFYFDSEFKVAGRINFVHLAEPYAYTNTETGSTSPAKYQVTLVMPKKSPAHQLLATLYKNPVLLAEVQRYACENPTLAQQIKAKLTAVTLHYLEDGDDPFFIEKRGEAFQGCVRHSFKGIHAREQAIPIPLWAHNGEKWDQTTRDDPRFIDGTNVVVYFKPALHQGYSFFNFVATKIAYIKPGDPFFLDVGSVAPDQDVTQLLESTSATTSSDAPVESVDVMATLDVPEDLL